MKITINGKRLNKIVANVLRVPIVGEYINHNGELMLVESVVHGTNKEQTVVVVVELEN